MQFTEEQVLLKGGAERFVKEHYDFEARRKRARLETGYDPELWAQMAELGWLMLPFSEEDGGLGGSLTDVALLAEALGRGLALEPWFATVMLGGAFVRHASSEAKARVLPGLMGGETMVAAGLLEPRHRFDLQACETRATEWAGRYKLEGVKSLTLAGAQAQDLVVLARTGGTVGEAEGRTLFLLSSDTPGLSRHGYRLRDDHAAADLHLEGVEVGPEHVIGDVGGASAILESVFADARLALAAEALGIAQGAAELTQEYASTRTQFGRPLAAFQVLLHRMTDMFVEAETTRSLVYAAAAADAADLPRLAAQAKLKASTAGLAITKDAIQIHGGIGVTEELVIGHWYRRMITLSMLLGDVADLRMATPA